VAVAVKIMAVIRVPAQEVLAVAEMEMATPVMLILAAVVAAVSLYRLLVLLQVAQVDQVLSLFVMQTRIRQEPLQALQL
jgi:hypothetical protein